MTRTEALENAERCFARAANINVAAQGPEGQKAIALKIQALAEVGKGYVELAKELRLGT